MKTFFLICYISLHILNFNHLASCNTSFTCSSESLEENLSSCNQELPSQQDQSDDYAFSYKESGNEVEFQARLNIQLDNIMQRWLSVSISYDNYNSEVLRDLRMRGHPLSLNQPGSFFNEKDQSFIRAYSSLITKISDKLWSYKDPSAIEKSAQIEIVQEVLQFAPRVKDHFLAEHLENTAKSFASTQNPLKVYNRDYEFVQFQESALRKTDSEVTGDILISDKDVYTALLKIDRRPVTYSISQRPLWPSSTYDLEPSHYHVVMQIGFDFGIYDSNRAVWIFQITHFSGLSYFVIVDKNGNLVIFEGRKPYVKWYSLVQDLEYEYTPKKEDEYTPKKEYQASIQDMKRDTFVPQEYDMFDMDIEVC